MSHLKDEFDRRGPWITQFQIDGEKVGGWYDPASGDRFPLFQQYHPEPKRVLELGCLEGGFSVLLGEIAEQVTAIDSRFQNLDRARWVASKKGLSNIDFRQMNLETAELTQLGHFDTVFNVGLLYHLSEPWNLLKRLALICESMFVWTHVAEDKDTLSERNGYYGKIYSEYGHADPLSGMSNKSFWPSTDELIRMLGDCGFAEVEVLREESHPPGPAVILTCRSAVALPRMTVPIAQANSLSK